MSRTVAPPPALHTPVAVVALAALLATALARPGTASAGERTTVAVLPVEGVNVPAEEEARHRARLVLLLAPRRDLELLDPSRTAEELGRASPGCASEIACLAQLGARLGAQKLLAFRVGRLGETTVLRLAVFDVRRAARQGSWQEVLRRPDEAALRLALERILTWAGLLQPSPVARPFYTRWWFWTAAGLVVAGAVATAIGVSVQKSAKPDVVILPPSR
jgi:hypothetical protein